MKLHWTSLLNQIIDNRLQKCTLVKSLALQREQKNLHYNSITCNTIVRMEQNSQFFTLFGEIQ